MKKSLFIILMFLLGTRLQSQIAPGKYYIQFTDKIGTPYSINNPGDFLSERSIERRLKQNIPIDDSDLPVNPAYVEGVAVTGAIILNRTKWLNGVTIFADSPSVLESVTELPYVSGISATSGSFNVNENVFDKFEKSFFKNEIYNQSALENANNLKNSDSCNYGQSYNQIQMIGGVDFHEMGYRGQGKVIAVLDAGFLNADTHIAFDSLWLNNQILGTRDFVKGGPTTFDDHPHGSMVLSCMGGNVPGQHIGTAPKASYWLLRSEDGNSEYLIEEYNWISAAEFADSVGADIINSSLGYTTFWDSLQNHTYADMDGNTTPVTRGADIAAEKGILVVNSLGNSGTSSWYYLVAPSDGDSVMGIGAVDASGNYVSFSSHGPSYDGRVKPDVVAQGSGVYVADPYGGSFAYNGGTSFSAPILAGMAACLWQANPDLNNMQILQAIRQSGNQYTSPDDLKGYGIPDIIQANNILNIVDDFGNDPLLVRYYPNPFSHEIKLQFSDEADGVGEVHVIDHLGKIISFSMVNYDSDKDLILNIPEHTPGGIYFLRVFNNDRFFNYKLLKR